MRRIVCADDIAFLDEVLDVDLGSGLGLDAFEKTLPLTRSSTPVATIMRVKEGQSFLDLYYEPGAVEIASGNVQHVLFDGRGADVRNSGQVSTPDKISDAMAAWLMNPNPREVLDPAAGFGHLLHACRRVNSSFKAVGIETDQEVFKSALTTAPKGTKLVLSDYLRNDPGIFQGIIANPPYVKSQRMALSDVEWQYF